MALIEFIKDVGGVVRLHFRDNLSCVVRVKVFQDVDCHVLVEFSKSVSCVLAGHTPQSADLGLEVEIFQMIGKVGGVYERRLVGGIPALIAFLLLVTATPVPILRAVSLCFFLHGLRKTFGLLGSHCVIFIKLVVLYVLYQLRRIVGICGVAGLLQAVSPTLVISCLQVEKELVAIPVAKKVRVILKRLVRGVIDPETLPFRIVIVAHRLTFPILVALDSEMVVAFGGQRRKPVTGLQNALSQCDAGRHTAAVHLPDSGRSPFLNIPFLRRALCPSGHLTQNNTYEYNNLSHLNIYNL